LNMSSDASQERIMLLMLLSEAARFQTNKSQVQELQRQVQSRWNDLEGSPQDKYIRLRGRLTTLFLWDREASIERDLDCPPFHILQELQSRQRQRLLTLPPGQLFHSPASEAVMAN